MLGGGYVSRQSIGSVYEGSPCARMEKRRRRGFIRRPLARIPSGDCYDFDYPAPSTDNMASVNASLISLNDAPPSPSSHPSRKSVDQAPSANQSRLSIYDVHFGSSRMSLARKGLLERQSLEDFCLTGEGEDSEPPSM